MVVVAFLRGERSSESNELHSLSSSVTFSLLQQLAQFLHSKKLLISDREEDISYGASVVAKSWLRVPIMPIQAAVEECDPVTLKRSVPSTFLATIEVKKSSARAED